MNYRSTVTLASNGRYWQAFYYDAVGGRRAKSLGAKAELSRRQAKVLCDRFAAEIQVSPAKATGSPAPRLDQYIQEYLASRTDLKPSSVYQLELTGRYLVEFFGAELRIDRITRSMCSAWRQGRTVSGSKEPSVPIAKRDQRGSTMLRRQSDFQSRHPYRSDSIQPVRSSEIAPAGARQGLVLPHPD